MTKTPPVPEQNRSQKGPGDPQGHPAVPETRKEKRNPDPEHKGRQANIRQNTHHQGYQQDR